MRRRSSPATRTSGGAWTGRPALFPDTSDVYVRDAGPDNRYKLGLRMVEAMRGLLDNHAAGAYSATYIAYPVNYGARTPGPYDWAVVRRLLDGRERIVVADGGIKLESRVYTENAAAAVLLAIDNPEIAAGKRYNVADRYAFTMRQRIEFIARHLGREVELVDMPYDVAWPCHPLYRHRRDHLLCQSTLIREELGYEDPVAPDIAMGRYVDWLVANPPESGGELERQVGDPFDYAAEDELIDRWTRARDELGEVVSPLPQQGHQYRHPKKAGEAWSVYIGERAGRTSSSLMCTLGGCPSVNTTARAMSSAPKGVTPLKPPLIAWTISGRMWSRSSVSTRPGSMSETRMSSPTVSWRSTSVNAPSPNFVRL